jgi:hypothetical protein
VALLNNDATVEPGWLAPLVSALEADPTVGAACPKILFDSSFVDVRLSSPAAARGRGDGRRLGVRVSGARVDGRDAWGSLQLVDGFWGVEFGAGDGEGQFEWTDGAAHLRVPARPDRTLPDCELRLAADEWRRVVVASGSRSSEHTVQANPSWYEAPLDGEPFDVVNNVGCDLLPDGMGSDRGYHERDEGQYDRVEEVFAWCGAAVVLSRRYLDAVGTFEERFFLYYEDFDLSWRGRAQGWRYVHVPGPPVRHVHSASTVEGSRLHHHYAERNRLLVLARNAPRPLAVRATARFVLVTGSYARRDVVVPLLGGRRPSAETVRRRLTSFAAYLGALPAALAARRRLRHRQVVPDEVLLGWQRPPLPAERPS